MTRIHDSDNDSDTRLGSETRIMTRIIDSDKWRTLPRARLAVAAEDVEAAPLRREAVLPPYIYKYIYIYI